MRVLLLCHQSSHSRLVKSTAFEINLQPFKRKTELYTRTFYSAPFENFVRHFLRLTNSTQSSIHIILFERYIVQKSKKMNAFLKIEICICLLQLEKSLEYCLLCI